MGGNSQNETGKDLKGVGVEGAGGNHCKDNKVHQNNEQLLREAVKSLFLV